MSKVRLTKKEMIEIYQKNRPFVPTDKRIGAYAKYLGYVRKTQRLDGKVVTFYIKKEMLEETSI